MIATYAGNYFQSSNLEYTAHPAQKMYASYAVKTRGGFPRLIVSFIMYVISAITTCLIHSLKII
jgi:hypothetical protein